MKDGLEYAEMLGLTVSSCDLTIKPAKRRRKKDVKEDVIAKVNEESVREDLVQSEVEEDSSFQEEYEDVTPKTKTKKFFKLDVLQVQGIAIFALIVTILLTNIFWENSGINRLLNSAFSSQAEQVDARNYLSFNAKSPSNELEVSLSEGVMTFSGKGALYPVCDGEVSAIVEEDGKYTMTISHSDSFKTVISGVDFVYTEKGEDVFGYIPVGYISDGSASVYMYDEDVLLTNYIVEDGAIIWES